MLCRPDTAIPNPAGVAGERIGVPILGLPQRTLLRCHRMTTFSSSIRVSRIRHEANAAAGQPFDFEYESVSAFALPGETRTTLDAYGFLNILDRVGSCKKQPESYPDNIEGLQSKRWQHMEIPGDIFKPFIGLVNQTTMVPVGDVVSRGR